MAAYYSYFQLEQGLIWPVTVCDCAGITGDPEVIGQSSVSGLLTIRVYPAKHRKVTVLSAIPAAIGNGIAMASGAAVRRSLRGER